jgi:hypothetical protein
MDTFISPPAQEVGLLAVAEPAPSCGYRKYAAPQPISLSKRDIVV